MLPSLTGATATGMAGGAAGFGLGAAKARTMSQIKIRAASVTTAEMTQCRFNLSLKRECCGSRKGSGAFAPEEVSVI